ncbi:MAG: hypothetical protein LBI28_03585 [Treponema sp.]|jgi:phage protein D|nr:hypothetical protein [Treponema sp.]
MSESKHLTPVWIIYADGRRLDTEYEGALRSITVTDKLNGASEFSIIFDTTEVKVREIGLLSFGSEMLIHMGYKDDIIENPKKVHKPLRSGLGVCFDFYKPAVSSY